MKTALYATVVYHINGFEQSPPQSFTIFNVPNENDVIMPFLQNYKYLVKSISANQGLYNIYLEPFCDNAKGVFQRQYINAG